MAASTPARVQQANPAQTGRELNLLCFDGGGVRGLSSLYILKHLMEMIDVDNPPRPCEYFDMIAGTSTGGLIAIMLGRLGMSVAECIDAYEKLLPSIFTKEHHRLKINGKFQGRFNHKALEKGVKDLLRDRGMSEDALMLDNRTGEGSCKTFVCATSSAVSRTVILSSYVNRLRGRDLADIAQIWQVARATSAATSFFDPVKIGHEEFVDGATPANNPVMELWAEASQVVGAGDDWKLESNLSCLVSIGTGVPPLGEFGDDPLAVSARLRQIATDSEKTARNFEALHGALCKTRQYFRFNVMNGLQNVKLEDEAKLPLIKSATRDYTVTRVVQGEMRECSEKLSSTRG
ncbi:acyl transferase/acyl hydrolase/lysophospholipase [Podospora aff. communis PSN243]|uniref:Acyl transferase/acyl hydrolase/lysophospholipase n=1 Tax=Podospora aff. communis PSN243 TaxID=3040156 RepID=A0AAV9GY17_9PEZI|nr:acyl transferase/acyl hydrolase/lysophospholipase [Podospora aff. communis PSN243]